MDINQIRKILPHAYPFLLVDRVLEKTPDTPNRVGQSVLCLKNVSINEGFFVGHFPHRPVMPGVLIVEAACQAGILAVAQKGEQGLRALLGRIGEVRFRRMVEPGDQLTIRAKVLKAKARVCVLDVQSFVKDAPVLSTQIVATCET